MVIMKGIWMGPPQHLLHWLWDLFSFYLQDLNNFLASISPRVRKRQIQFTRFISFPYLMINWYTVQNRKKKCSLSWWSSHRKHKWTQMVRGKATWVTGGTDSNHLPFHLIPRHGFSSSDIGLRLALVICKHWIHSWFGSGDFRVFFLSYKSTTVKKRHFCVCGLNCASVSSF